MKILLLVLASLIVVGCGGANNSSDSEEVSVPMVNGEHGSAQEYTAERLEELKGEGKRFAIFVGADWCPGCKRLTKEIHANQASLPKDTVILTADFDTTLELRREYGVTVKHTGVYFDEEGNHLKTQAGVIFQDFMAHLSDT